MKLFLRFLIYIGIVFTAFFPFGLSAQNNSLGLNTVVIDPGHGGNDPGCISKDKKTREKDLTLDISRRLAKKIRAEYPQMKVLQTRNSDVFIPLVDRAKIANNAHANLFISVHINATTGTSANGYSVHILGQSSKKGRDLYFNNFNECARENSVILLEDDYSTNYQGFDPNDPESSILFSLMQNAYLEQSLMFADDVAKSLKGGPFRTSRGVHQDPFLVLWKTAMPSVLIECGFISNASDLAVLRNDAKLDEIAEGIFRAFKTFKADYDRSLNVGKSSASADSKTSAASGDSAEKGGVAVQPQESKPSGDKKVSTDEQPAATEKVSSTRYGTQIFAVKRLLKGNAPEFKGLKVEAVLDGSIYRYVAGISADRSSALKEYRRAKEKFPDAFFVKLAPEGQITRESTK